MEILEKIGLLIVVMLIAALPTMWLWNWLMPHLFDLTSINFLEALGICLLSSALFKSNTLSKTNE